MSHLGALLYENTCMVLCHSYLIKYSVGFPPPMMLSLSKRCLTIMSIQIRIVCVCAFSNYCSKRVSGWLNNLIIKSIIGLLITFNVPGTIVFLYSRKLMRMGLYWMRIKNLKCSLKATANPQLNYKTYLHYFTEINRLNQIIDIFVVKIMRKYYQRSRYISSLS